MDQIKVIRINTPKKWLSYMATSDNLRIDGSGLSIQKENTYFFEEDISIDIKDMRDIALDECENVYLVDGQSSGIYIYDRYFLERRQIVSCDGSLPYELKCPVGIAIDSDTIYVVDIPPEDVPAVVAFARQSRQLKWAYSFSGDTIFKDIAVDTRGSIYLLTSRSVEVMNPSGETVRSLSPPETESPMKEPTDISVALTGEVYVLDREVIHIFNEEGYKKIEIKFSEEYDFIPKGLSLSNDSEIFIGEAIERPAQETIYRVSHQGVLQPLWTYRDTTRRIINDARGNIYVINGKGQRLSFLRYREVISRNEEGDFIAIYESKPIDSGKKGTLWHRFQIEGTFLSDTKVNFYYFISDEIDKDLSKIKWTEVLATDASAQGQNIRQGLFLVNNKGQYLWFKITLSGNIDSTAQIRVLNLYYPRYAYLEFLPALYRENLLHADFLERFLSIFETFFAETDYLISHISRYMDVLGVPEDFLDWLGRWLSFELYDALPPAKKRLLLQKAMQLYRMKGTREAVETLVEVIAGQRPFVVENIRVENSSCEQEESQLNWCVNQEDTIFRPSESVKVKCEEEEDIILSRVLYGKDPFSVCVFLRDRVSEETYNVLKNMIDDFSPAHTSVSVSVLEPWFYLDGHTYLGVNTVLNKSIFILEKSSVIGRDTVLTDIEECAQISRKSRVEMDFKII